MPKKLHYIFDSRAPQSPAKPLQALIVLKKNAAHCRRWVKDIRRLIGEQAKQSTFDFAQSHPLIRNLSTYSDFINHHQQHNNDD